MRKFIILVGLLAVLPAAAIAESHRISGVPQMIVQGTGQVSLNPDIATVSVGVVVEAETAEAALAGNTEQMTAVFAALGAAGIDSTDIRTTEISLSPKWHHPGSGQDRTPRIVGFVAANTVEIRVRALEGLGGVLDTVVRSGANRVNAIRFGLDDPVEAQDTARERAVKDAIRKAGLYAAAAGVPLGRVLEISEIGAAHPGPRPMFEASMVRDTAAVPVAGGELTISAQVSIRFALDE